MIYKILKAALLTVGSLLAFNVVAEITDTDIEYSFWPYKDGPPKVEGITVGMRIDASNAASLEHAFDPGTYEFIKNGDYSITVGRTMDFDMPDVFIELSKVNRNVGFDDKGLLTNYVNGRPFPHKPNANDPDAGTKLIWNFQYGRVWGDLGCMEPWYWDFKNMRTGKVERTIKYDRVCMKRSAYKSTDSPIPEDLPNPGQVYRKIYLKVAEPFDVKNTQVLIHKYKDDTKRLDGWLYLGFQRRVRRMATGQITDAFLGSDIMIEDFEGYEGRVSDYTWEYQGETTLLMPMWNHNETVKGYSDIQRSHKPADDEHYDYINFVGKGGCFPDAPWMLRKLYIVKGSPKDPYHPLSQRIIYIDAQTNEMPISLIYDRGGKYWKWWLIGWPHLDHHLAINKGKGAMIGDAVTMVDVQAQHCTTLSFYGKVDPSLADNSLFTVQQLRISGR
ncbi:MAG: DUF1329 domain-containing protein [Gammaproteobacteria bacterium]|nr:DUF1329 domain-containing protein [Gammaproteobacteria bacterium]